MNTPAWLPTIKEADPHHVLVYRDDATPPRKVPITKRRQKWQALARVLDAMEWVRLEACDVDGGPLAVWPPTAPRSSRAPAAPSVPDMPPEWSGPATALLHVQAETWRASQAHTEAIIGGYQSLLTSLAGSVADLRGICTDLAQQNRTLLRTLNEAVEDIRGASEAGEGAGGGDPGLVTLLSLVAQSNERRRRSDGPPPRPVKPGERAAPPRRQAPPATPPAPASH